MEPISYYLVFSDSDLWIGKFMKKGFSHIEVVAFDGINWVVFDPTRVKLDWKILPIEPENEPFDVYYQDKSILKISSLTGNKPKWIGRVGLMSCVLLIKYIVGIQSCSITPHQLYKYLLKNGIGEDHGKIGSRKKS